MSDSRKRKRVDNNSSQKKKQKAFFKRMHHRNTSPAAAFEPGISGIFVSCPKHAEKSCLGECYDLCYEYAEKLYGSSEKSELGGDNKGDVEAAIEKELAQMKKPHREYQFSSIQTGIDCLVFVKTNPPVDSVQFVHYLLTDLANTQQKKARHIQRIIPITKTCLANMPAILELAKTLLQPNFHPEGQDVIRNIQYAIVPRIRYNNSIEKMSLIEKLAALVGKEHTVNLDNPELVVIVEILKNICGISVVRDYYKLKRYNLEVIFETKEKQSEQGVSNRSTLTATKTVDIAVDNVRIKNEERIQSEIKDVKTIKDQE